MSKNSDEKIKPKLDVCYPVFLELIQSYGSLDAVLKNYPDFAGLVYSNSCAAKDSSNEEISHLIGDVGD